MNISEEELRDELKHLHVKERQLRDEKMCLRNQIALKETAGTVDDYLEAELRKCNLEIEQVLKDVAEQKKKKKKQKKQSLWDLAEAAWTGFLKEAEQVSVVFFEEQWSDSSLNSKNARFHCQGAVNFIGKIFSECRYPKFPMMPEIFQRFRRYFPELHEHVCVMTFTLYDMREYLCDPIHELQIANEKLELYLSEIIEMRHRLDNCLYIPERQVQNMYRPLYELIEHIMRCVLRTVVTARIKPPKDDENPNDDGASISRVYEMEMVGNSALASRNFIRPGRKPDFILTAAANEVDDALVLACMELKASNKQADECLNKLLEFIGGRGSLWVECLYYDVKFFLAFTGNAQGCIVHIVSKNYGMLQVRKATEFSTKSMGVNTMYKFLLAIMYNYRAFAEKIMSDKPYTLITDSSSSGRYWVNPMDDHKISSVVIRTSDMFPAWVEKRVRRRQDLLALCNISAGSNDLWCPHLAKVIGQKGLMHRTGTRVSDFIVQKGLGDVVLRFTTAGHHPSCTVETIDHLSTMSDHVLQALKFLHKMQWVHGAPHLHSIIRTSESHFVLADWDAAEKISISGVTNGTAAVPSSATDTTCAFVSGATMRPKRWRPVYDLKVFIGSAIITAAHRVIARMASQVASNVTTLLRGMESRQHATVLYKRICSATRVVIDLTARKLLLPKYLDELQEQDEARMHIKAMPLTASDVEYVALKLFEVSNKKKYMTHEEVWLDKLLEQDVNYDYMDTDENSYKAQSLLRMIMGAQKIDVDEIRQVWDNFKRAVHFHGDDEATSLLKINFDNFCTSEVLHIDSACMDIERSAEAGTSKNDVIQPVDSNKRQMASKQTVIRKNTKAAAKDTKEQAKDATAKLKNGKAAQAAQRKKVNAAEIEKNKEEKSANVEKREKGNAVKAKQKEKEKTAAAEDKKEEQAAAAEKEKEKVAAKKKKKEKAATVVHRKKEKSAKQKRGKAEVVAKKSTRGKKNEEEEESIAAKKVGKVMKNVRKKRARSDDDGDFNPRKTRRAVS